MIQSKLKWTIIPVIILACVYPVLIISLLVNFNSAFSGPGGGAFVICLLTFSFWILLYQIRIQTQKIVIEGHSLTVTNWGGLGKEKLYAVTQLNGFHTSKLTTRVGNYKVIYIMQGKRKIARIIETNAHFTETEHYVKNHLKDLGFIHTGIFSDIQDSFRF